MTAISVACGGDRPPSPPATPSPTGPPATPSPSPGPAPPPTGAVQIRGGERLGWNQFAGTLADLRTHTFLLFVDGTAAALTDAQCGDTAGASGYECSGRLPAIPAGTHSLELAAVWNGTQSSRSAPLMVSVMVAQQGSASDVANGGTGAATRPMLADGLGPATWLAPTPDGRLLFVENGTAVRIIDGELLPDAAYELASPGETIVGLAVDPQFDRTRAVYIAETETAEDGSLAVNVSRLREVGNVLGQRATIVHGLPFAKGASLPLAVDGEGLLYAAVPAADVTAARERAGRESTGLVLRFTSDGFVPRGNPRHTPILAVGFARPSALAIEAGQGRLWLAGNDPAWDYSVAVLNLEAPDESAWPQVPRAGLPSAADSGGFKPSSLSIFRAVNITFASRDVVRRGVFAPDGTISAIEAIIMASPGIVSAIVSGPDGTIYAAILSADGLTSSIQVLGGR